MPGLPKEPSKYSTQKDFLPLESTIGEQPSRRSLLACPCGLKSALRPSYWSVCSAMIEVRIQGRALLLEAEVSAWLRMAGLLVAWPVGFRL
jgi:hypothetical protein